MRKLFVSAKPALTVPGTNRRVLRRPDLRGIQGPAAISGAPLSVDGEDHGDLIVHRAWRGYSSDELVGNEPAVKYFMFEFSQRSPDEAGYWHGFKAVRLLRLTRVPRYLRQGSAQGGPGLVFDQMRDVLVGLREQGTLFIQVIANAPDLGMVFAYGVQGVGETPELAQQAADVAYSVLRFQLDGTFQQLEYAPLSRSQGEALARYQQQWDEVAVARGRPIPAGGSVSAALFDGNRTDIESTANQLESVLRGLADSSFMMSLITVPVAPVQMSAAWRNLTDTLSRFRSDQQGSRSVSFGVALPFSAGASQGDSHGNTHTSGATEGAGDSVGHATSATDSVSHTDGTSQTDSATAGVTHTESASETHGVATSVGESYTEGVTHGQSMSLGDSTGQNFGASSSEQVSAGQSQGLTQGQSISETSGISEGQSLASGQSVGTSWSASQGQSIGSSVTHSLGNSQSLGESLNQSTSWSGNLGESLSGQEGFSSGSGINGGVPGIIGGNSSGGSSQYSGWGLSQGQTLGNSLTGGSTSTTGVSETLANALNQGFSTTEGVGTSQGQSLTATNSVGQSHSVGVGQSLSASESQSVSHSQGVGTSQGLSRAQSLTQGQSLANAQTQGQTVAASESASTSRGVSVAESQTVGRSVGTSSADTVGRSVGETHSAGANSSRALSDAYAVAMSRSAQQSGSLGVVPNIGVAFSKATFDEAKRKIGDMLAVQVERYERGIRGGAFLYQLILQCPDRETLVGAEGLMKSAFWGDQGEHVPAPFHTVDTFDQAPDRHADEARRLLAHARVWTSYRRREPVMDLIEPFMYSSFVTADELACLSHPPTAESIGLLAVHDSMPVFAMPADRANRSLYLGRLWSGERGRVSQQRYGIDPDELTHVGIFGKTGSGKTTTTERLVTGLVSHRKTHTPRATLDNPNPQPEELRGSVLIIDWLDRWRQLASITEPERFRLYSVRNAELGAFRWNLLAIPSGKIPVAEWVGQLADTLAGALGVGEVGRSLIFEFAYDLYSANRLRPFELRPAVVDENTGEILRPAVQLPAIDRSELPAEAITVGPDGELANCFTYPELSRLVSIQHLALMVLARSELLATPDGGRLYGTSARDRVQSLFRRVQPYLPGGTFDEVVACDPSLADRKCLTIEDLIDPASGRVTVIEADGLDGAGRRLILGSVMLALYRHGLANGQGCFDQDGAGPGLWVVIEEAHEVIGTGGNDDDDQRAVQQRVSLYEQLFRRSRATGMHLLVVAQNPSELPAAVRSNLSAVLVHQLDEEVDRRVVANLMNWSNAVVGGHIREMRFIGELPVGSFIGRLSAKTSFLEAAPVMVQADPAPTQRVTDTELAQHARWVESLR